MGFECLDLPSDLVCNYVPPPPPHKCLVSNIALLYRQGAFRNSPRGFLFILVRLHYIQADWTQ